MSNRSAGEYAKSSSKGIGNRKVTSGGTTVKRPVTKNIKKNGNC